jgi:short-subunit dehydrogenase
MRKNYNSNKDKRYVVVTGVSSGIGYAIAQELINHGFHVFGSIRKEEDGDRVKNELGSQFTPLLFDLLDHTAIRDSSRYVKDIIGDACLTGLVNNAGIAISGPLMHLQVEEVQYQFQVNVFGMLAVTQTFLPLLGATKPRPAFPGRIINIGSISGRLAFPFIGPYCGSKHALEAFSDTLRRELMIYGIDVIVVQPGNIRTPIWEKMPDLIIYDQTDYASIMKRLKNYMMDELRNDFLPVDMVTQKVRKILTMKRPKTRYLVARHKILGWWLPRWLPDRWLDNIIANRLGMKGK